MVDAQIKGMDDLLKSLNKFSDNFQKKVVRGAVRAGAAGIAKDVKNNVPVDKGALKYSIGLTQRKSRSRSLIGYIVSPRKDLLKKALLKGNKKLGWSVSKVTGYESANWHNYGGYVEFGHSHVSAQPFMRPAYENMGPESIKIAREYMAKRIDKEIERAKL